VKTDTSGYKITVHILLNGLRLFSIELTCCHCFADRVVTRGTEQEIAGHRFTGFGAHHSDYPCTYLTAAAALGITKLDVDSFIRRLDKVFTKKMMTAAAGQTADVMATLTVNDSEVCSVAAAVSDSQDHEQSDDDDDDDDVAATLEPDSPADGVPDV